MIQGSEVTVRPAKNLSGSLRLPGDKSISHRYAMLGALAEGKSRLENFSTGADCASTLTCLHGLGVSWERQSEPENTIEITGTAGRLSAPSAPLNCGNSGSTMRMLSGILAGQQFPSELFGDESLSRRPMARVINPLTAMGAEIHAGPQDRPPLRIAGGRLRAIDFKMPVASAQVKSCVLFAGLFADGETRVEEPLRTRDHGEVALRAFGAELQREGNATRIRGGQKLHAIQARVPGDLSSAAFFFCAAALFPGSQLVVDSLLMNPTRARLLDILMALGVRISITQLEEQHGELVGTVKAEGDRLTSAKISGADTSSTHSPGGPQKTDREHHQHRDHACHLVTDSHLVFPFLPHSKLTQVRRHCCGAGAGAALGAPGFRPICRAISFSLLFIGCKERK